MSVKERIRSEKRKSYNYCSDLFEEKYICIFSCESGESIAVKLSWDETMDRMLEANLNNGEAASEVTPKDDDV